MYIIIIIVTVSLYYSADLNARDNYDAEDDTVRREGWADECNEALSVSQYFCMCARTMNIAR